MKLFYSTLKKNKFISKVLLKYISTYLLVFILPLMIGMLVLYNNSTKVVSGFIDDQNRNTLERIAITMDEQVSELREIPVLLLSTEETFRPYYIKSSQYNVMELMAELKKYSTTNRLIYDLGFYIRDNPTVYLSSSTCDFDYFYDSRYKFLNYSSQEIYNALNNSTKPFFIPASPIAFAGGTPQNMVIYLYPVSPGSLHPYATVFFIINESDLLKTVQSSKYNPSIQNIIVTDIDGNIICSSDDNEYFSVNDFEKLNMPIVKIDTDTPQENDQYVIANYYSASLEWMFYLVTPKQIITERTQVLKNTLWATIIAAVTLGIILAFAMSYYSYKPIKWLRESISHISPSAKANDDFNYIQSGIKQLSIEKTKLNSTIMRNREAVRNYVLTQYLYGFAHHISSLDEMAEDTGIILNHKVYCAAIFKIDKVYTSIHYKKFARNIENYLGEENFDSYAVAESQHSRILVLLANNICEIRDIKIKETLSTISKKLANNDNISGKWGVGKLINSKKELGRSLMEATAALDYYFPEEGELIFHANDMESNERSIHTLDLEVKIQRLKLFIYQNDTEAIEKSINGIIDTLKTSKLPPFLLRCYCYDVLNEIIGVNQILKPDDIKYLTSLNDMFIPNHISSTNDIVEIIKKTAAYITKTNMPANLNATLIERIMDYIKNNCFDWNFSVQNLSEEFDMSPSNISHFFKTKTDYNITTFVLKLRLEKACELLQDTDLTVKEISSKIGYIDVSSFIKIFRNKYNVTPGNYRNISRN